jgi:hypothetical protein
MMFLGIVLMVAGMAVSVGAPAEARDARVLEARGVETTATVTSVDIRGGGKNSSPYAVVDLDYEDEFGLPVTAAGVIYCGEEDDIVVGGKVQITYDPEEQAPAQFTACPQSQAIAIPTIIGVVVLAAGTVCVLWGWRAGGWRRRWWGIGLVLLGILMAGASSEDDCNCTELVYTGAALVVVGAVPLVAPRSHAPSLPDRPTS